VTDAAGLLASARTVLIVDWPSTEVPESLARAGYGVVVHGGPGPADYTAWEAVGTEVVRRRVGRAPERVDIVYTHRPLDELTEIVAAAVTAGARAVWVQSGVDGAGAGDPRGCWLADGDAARARAVVEGAGLAYVDQPYIVDALPGHPQGPDDEGDLER
jgi:predicted CoA-binding protein